jgi:hypothetical protein
MSLLSAKEYFRMFWWFAAVIPLFGLFMLIFGRGPLQVIGLMGLLWPLTIPGRSFLSSSKSSRLFTRPCEMEADEEKITFSNVPTALKPLRFTIRAMDIRDIAERGDLLLIRTRRLGFAPIRREAFLSSEDEDAFFQLVAEMVRRRLDG